MLMDFETVLLRVGTFGRFQLLCFAVSSLGIICSCAHTMLSVFIAPTLDFRCGDAHAQPDAGNGSDWMTSSAHTCSYIVTFQATENATGKNVSAECTEWIYDKSVYSSTVVSKWDLVCSDAWRKAMSTSLYMFGQLLGVFFFSWLSDRFGRRLNVLMTLSVATLGGVGVAFSPTYSIFVFFRAVEGAGSIGLYTASWLLGLEAVGVKHRTRVGMLTCIFFGIGYMVVAALGYFIRDYSWLTLAVTVVTGFPAAILCCFVSESARWLLARGDVIRAEHVIRRMARINGSKFPEDLFTDEALQAAKQLDEGNKAAQKTYWVGDILRYKNMRLLTLNMCFNWTWCGIPGNIGPL